MTLPHQVRRCFIGRQVHLLSRLRLQQFVPCEPRSRGITLGNQLIDDGPALRIQRQADGVWLVPKNEAQELAELSSRDPMSFPPTPPRDDQRCRPPAGTLCRPLRRRQDPPLVRFPGIEILQVLQQRLVA